MCTAAKYLAPSPVQATLLLTCTDGLVHRFPDNASPHSVVVSMCFPRKGVGLAGGPEHRLRGSGGCAVHQVCRLAALGLDVHLDRGDCMSLSAECQSWLKHVERGTAEGVTRQREFGVILHRSRARSCKG